MQQTPMSSRLYTRFPLRKKLKIHLKVVLVEVLSGFSENNNSIIRFSVRSFNMAVFLNQIFTFINTHYLLPGHVFVYLFICAEK